MPRDRRRAIVSFSMFNIYRETLRDPWQLEKQLKPGSANFGSSEFDACLDVGDWCWCVQYSSSARSNTVRILLKALRISL